MIENNVHQTQQMQISYYNDLFGKVDIFVTNLFTLLVFFKLEKSIHPIRTF